MPVSYSRVCTLYGLYFDNEIGTSKHRIIFQKWQTSLNWVYVESSVVFPKHALCILILL